MLYPWHVLYPKSLEPGDICRSGVPLGCGSGTQWNLEALSGQLSQTDPLWSISGALTPAEVPWNPVVWPSRTLANFTGTKWGRRVGHRRQGLLAFLQVLATRPVWFPEPRCQRHFGPRMQIVKLDTEEGSLIYPFGWIFLWFILRKNAQIFHLSPVEPKRQRTSGLRVNGVGREEMLICSGCQFPWWEYAHHGWVQATKATSWVWSGAAMCTGARAQHSTVKPTCHVCRRHSISRLAGSGFQVTQKWRVSEALGPQDTAIRAFPAAPVPSPPTPSVLKEKLWMQIAKPDAEEGPLMTWAVLFTLLWLSNIKLDTEEVEFLLLFNCIKSFCC